MKYTLKKPIQIGESGPPITEFNFREEVCAGDLRGVKMSALSDPAPEDILKIAARLCGQTDVVMGKLSFGDTLAVAEAVGGFLAAGLETGSKS